MVSMVSHKENRKKNESYTEGNINKLRRNEYLVKSDVTLHFGEKFAL